MKARIKIEGTGQPSWKLMDDVIKPSFEQHEAWIDEIDADLTILHDRDDALEISLVEAKNYLDEKINKNSTDSIERDSNVAKELFSFIQATTSAQNELRKRIIDANNEISILRQRSNRPWIVNAISDLWRKFADRNRKKAGTAKDP